MKEKFVSIPFAIASCILSAFFSIGVFYASVENRLKSLETSQTMNADVKERVVRIETKVDMLLTDNKIVKQ